MACVAALKLSGISGLPGSVIRMLWIHNLSWLTRKYNHCVANYNKSRSKVRQSLVYQSEGQVD